MGRRTKEERWIEIHQRMMNRFRKIIAVVQQERKLSLEDRRFYSIAGAQWEGALGDQFENKPMLEVNKTHLAVMRIINEYRNNKITVNFISKDGSGTPDDADVANGLFRADEQDSSADEAYDNAFEEAVGGGFGAFRLRAAYENDEDDDDDKQRIRFEAITDADSSVFFDLGAKRQDKSDARFCFVLTPITPEAFEEDWGEDPTSWPKEINFVNFDWVTDDAVFLAEYYEIEEKKDVCYTYQDITGGTEKHYQSEFDEDPELKSQLEQMSYKLIKTKNTTKKVVHKYIASGASILEDCGLIAGKNIPIVPVYGKRWMIDNIERFMGHVRLVKDSQRLKNMQVSKLAELSAMSSVEKPIFTSEQIAGHEEQWAEDNIKNYAYQTINAIVDPTTGQSIPSGPVGYTKSPSMPEAMAALLQLTDNDMADILGNRQGQDKITSHVSGKALEMWQVSMDMPTFTYISNFSKAMRRAGEIWKGMAVELYVDQDRSMKVVDAQGQPGQVKLMQPGIAPDGSQTTTNDISKIDFDVAVDVGPSTVSRKEAIVRQITGMLQFIQDQQTVGVLSSFAMMNLEGEGMGDLREYFRKQLVNQGAVKPSAEEAEALAAAGAKPDQQTELMKAATEQALAEADKARTEIIQILSRARDYSAKAELSHAQALQILKEIGVSVKMTEAPTDLPSPVVPSTPNPAPQGA